MPIPVAELRRVYAASGGRCAFPNCRRYLIAAGSGGDPDTVLGEIAHIVAEHENGPRGAHPLSMDERNRADNLVLLCHIHHQLVDDQPQRYTVAALRQMRDDHVTWARERLGRGTNEIPIPDALVEDTLHSTLLPIESLPSQVYSAPCDLTEREVATRVRWPRGASIVAYVVRSGRLLTFNDLRHSDGPFADVLATAGDPEPLEPWFSDTRLDWFLALTNQAIAKLMRHRGLAFDKPHHRYYFAPRERNQPVEITYRPLNQKAVRTSVVWQPVRRATGEARRYWLHRAISVRVIRTGGLSFALSLRPELHVTTDGFQDYSARYVGSKVTRRKARWFNHEYLGQVQLWRDFLSASTPRIVLPFGGSSVVIDATLLTSKVRWPGIPAQFDADFANSQTSDTLFSYLDYVRRDDPLDDIDLDEEGDDDDD